jgi:hypothetical protein
MGGVNGLPVGHFVGWLLIVVSCGLNASLNSLLIEWLIGQVRGFAPIGIIGLPFSLFAD